VPLNETHVEAAFVNIDENGILPNKASTKWDIKDPKTGKRYPPKAVLRVAKKLANDESYTGGGGPPTNDPLRELGFEIALKPHLEEAQEAEDLTAIIKSDADDTTKRSLVNARLGQGSFRAALMEYWQERCPITGCQIDVVLRASHIKPWSESSNRERLDPSNGILLAASIDALFDRHFITFDRNGSLNVNSTITPDAMRKLGALEKQMTPLSSDAQRYLDTHRSAFQEKAGGKFYVF
jgi:hypothetical protein